MRVLRPLILLVGFVSIVIVVAMYPATRGAAGAGPAAVNSPPIANDDTFNRHGSGYVGPLLANDYDPDGDPMHVQILTFPAHGTLSGVDGDTFYYQLNNLSFTGTDTFTYEACDNQNACSNPATVALNIVNA